MFAMINLKTEKYNMLSLVDEGDTDIMDAVFSYRYLSSNVVIDIMFFFISKDYNTRS